MELSVVRHTTQKDGVVIVNLMGLDLVHAGPRPLESSYITV